MSQLIAIVNRTTVLTDAQASVVVPAFQAQVTEDWLPHWPGRGATLQFVGLKDPVPTGAWPLYLLDHTDIPNAGGYHDDDNNLPQGKVFVADAMQYGEAWTVDATHELLEILGDPQTNTIIDILHTQLRCLNEVADVCEADRYGYLKHGVLVTDFCLPGYFSGATSGPYDFGGHLHKPVPSLLHGGYLGIELPNGEWTQIFKRKDDGTMSRRAQRSGRTAERIG